MWSFGRQTLGLSEFDFWRLTLREFDALADRWNSEEAVVDTHFALILCQTANLNRDEKKHPLPFKLEEFLVRRSAPAPKLEKTEKPKQTVEDMKRITTGLTIGLGGEMRKRTEVASDGR